MTRSKHLLESGCLVALDHVGRNGDCISGWKREEETNDNWADQRLSSHKI